MYIEVNKNTEIDLDAIDFEKIKSLKELDYIAKLYERSCCEVISKANIYSDKITEGASYKEIPNLLECMVRCGRVASVLLLSINDLKEYIFKEPVQFSLIAGNIRSYRLKEVLKELGEETLKEFSNKFPEEAYNVYKKLDQNIAAYYIGEYLPREYINKYIKECKPYLFNINKYLFDENLATIYFIFATANKYFGDYKYLMKYHDIEKLYERAKPYMNPEDIEFVEFFKKLNGFEKLKDYPVEED